jgi:predicted amidohydrolase YtcJ
VLVQTLRAFADSSLRMGVTSVQDMAGYEEPALTVRAFRDARLPIRVRLVRWPAPSGAGRNEGPWNAVSEHPAPRVVVSGRKWIIDGTPIERNALQRQAYPDGSHGRLNFPLDTVRAILAEALRPGAAQLQLHIVGDSTTLLVLDAMESLAPDSIWRSKRVRFEHGNGIVGPAVARARRLGIVIAQPRGGAPLRTWRDAGIPLAYGSDGFRNPFYHLMTAITGEVSPAESLTREEAVTMLTRGSAYAERAEHEKGTLAPGMLADVAVLSQDDFNVPPTALPGTSSELTIVGGRIVRDHLTSTNGQRARER